MTPYPCKLAMPFLRLLFLSLALTLSTAAAANTELREIDWLDMIPPDELAELENMPPIELDHSGATPAPVLGSSRTVPAMDGVEGRLPGYIVPLAADDKNRVTEFFLVPYYGACIHVPPPPGNQIVHVKLDRPIANVQIWNPYWIEGTLRIRGTSNEVAQAAYAFDVDRVVPYE